MLFHPQVGAPFKNYPLAGIDKHPGSILGATPDFFFENDLLRLSVITLFAGEVR
jgi:hypothetical protein